MSVVFLILKIIGFILLGLLALLALLMLFPAILKFEYADGRLVIRYRYLFLQGTLMDTGVEEVAETAEELAEEAGVPEEKARKIPFGLEQVRELLGPVARAGRFLLRRLHIYDVRVLLVASGGDAAETGILAGRMWAGAGAGMSLLTTLWPRIRYKEIMVVPDFMGQYEDETRASFKLRAAVFILVLTALKIMPRLMRTLMKGRKPLKENQPEKESIQA